MTRPATQDRVGQRSAPVRRVLVAALVVALCSCTPKNILVRPDVAPGSLALQNREALLVLPGLGWRLEGSRAIEDFAHTMRKAGFDVFVANVSSRKGLDDSVRKLGDFVERQQLGHYGKLHIFAYILGGATLNRFLQTQQLPNLTTIVYDRSPLQERVGGVLVEEIPTIARVFGGDAIFDLASNEAPAFQRAGVSTGLIIENRATWIVRLYKDETLALGPLSFAPEALSSSHVDHCYVWLDHFAMYHAFDVVGPEVLSFIRTGRFSNQARRLPFKGDPFAR